MKKIIGLISVVVIAMVLMIAFIEDALATRCVSFYNHKITQIFTRNYEDAR